MKPSLAGNSAARGNVRQTLEERNRETAERNQSTWSCFRPNMFNYLVSASLRNTHSRPSEEEEEEEEEGEEGEEKERENFATAIFFFLGHYH